MRSKLLSLLTVIGAVTVLVLAANTVALATTGKAILAGKINTSSKMTSLVRTTPGTGLQVKTASAANPPFAVNGKGKVVNLNVDKVDGLDGGTRAYSYTYSGVLTGTKTFTLTGLPAGKYLASYEVSMTSISTADNLYSGCYFRTDVGGYKFGGEDHDPETAATNPVLGGTALMTPTATSDLHLVCYVPVGAEWTTNASQPIRITAVPLAGVTGLNPSVARSAARSGK